MIKYFYGQPVSAVVVDYLHFVKTLTFIVKVQIFYRPKNKMASTLMKKAFKVQFYQPVKSILHLNQGIKPSCKFRSSSFRSFAEDGDPNIIRSNLPDISIPSSSLYSIIWESGIKNHGNKIALVSIGSPIEK